jgi:hypothetical protein
MPLPNIGTVFFDNVSGDIPRAHFDYETFVIPGVNGTGTVVTGQRFPDQVFQCSAFCVDLASVIAFKNACEGLQMNVVPITNSLGESWATCLILNVHFSANSTIGVLAYNVPNDDNPPTVRSICRYFVNCEITVRFLYTVQSE